MPASPNVTVDAYDSLLSTTLRNYSSKLTDVVFSKRPLLNWLKTGDRIKNKDGGAAIVVPIIYGLNDTVSSYYQYDTIATTPQDGVKAAQYDWAQMAASIAIHGLEEAQNAGAEQIIDLLDTKRMQAEESMAEKLDYMFFQDGSNNSGKDPLGLAAIVSATDTAYGSAQLGGIAASSTTTRGDASSFNYWQSTVTNVAGALTIGTLSNLYNTVSQGTNDFPDLSLTTQTQFQNYEGLLQPQLRFSNPSQADAGFQNLLYKGSTIFWDVYAPSGTWFMLNSKYITLYTLKGKWMTTTDFYRPPNQDARFAQILSYFQLTTNCRFKHGKLTGLT